MIPVLCPVIPAMSEAAVAKVRSVEQAISDLPQLPIITHHLIHGGMYARTVLLETGWAITGALIKRATVLILNGDATVYNGAGPVRFTGYCVIPASAHRKQAFIAHSDTHLTMLFPTTAKTVEDAEAEFTDEADLLVSRRGENVVNITGE